MAIRNKRAYEFEGSFLKDCCVILYYVIDCSLWITLFFFLKKVMFLFLNILLNMSCFIKMLRFIILYYLFADYIFLND